MDFIDEMVADLLREDELARQRLASARGRDNGDGTVTFQIVGSTTKRRAVGGGEQDAVFAKRWFRWRPGERKYWKRKANRRERREGKREAMNRAEAERDSATDGLAEVFYECGFPPAFAERMAKTVVRLAQEDEGDVDGS